MDAVVPNHRGSFKADAIPPFTYSLGDDVFVYVCYYKDDILVHVRKFNRYGDTFYPSCLGVTLTPFLFFHLTGQRRSIAEEPLETYLTDLNVSKAKVHVTTDVEQHTIELVREYISQSGLVYKYGLVIDFEQWNNLLRVKDSVTTNIVTLVYSGVDFQRSYEKVCVTADSYAPILFESLLYSHLEKVLHKHIFNKLSFIVALLSPDTENSIEAFNSSVLELNVDDIAADYYASIASEMTSSGQTLDVFVTADFLKSVAFIDLLNKARIQICNIGETLHKIESVIV